MSSETARLQAAGLRPAEAGAALAGGARPAHLAATLIDLRDRGYLRTEAGGDEDNPDWLLTRCALPAGHDQLARYEKALLRGLPRRAQRQPLWKLEATKRWVKAIGRVYHQLDREAVLRGCVRPAQPEETGPDAAAETRAELHAFREYLSRLEPTGSDPETSLPGYLPYAIAFGLAPEWSRRFAGLRAPDTASATGSYQARGNQYALAAAFTAHACAHIQSAASQAGYGGAGGYGGGFTPGHDGMGGHHAGGFPGGAGGFGGGPR